MTNPKVHQNNRHKMLWYYSLFSKGEKEEKRRKRREKRKKLSINREVVK